MALIPTGYLNAVVSLGVIEESFKHIGTGFLYSHPILKNRDRTQYHTFLVTNRHVVEDRVSHVRFNRVTDGSPEVQPIASVTRHNWTLHPNGADVAAIPISSPGLLMDGRDMVKPEVFLGDVGTPSDEEWRHIMEGNGVFVIGFPLGLTGNARNYPIIRQGVISRIQSWLERNENTFLIDSPAFPGNSGGPVVLKPENVAVTGTKPITHSLLIGVISSNITSRDVAISTQTNEPRIVFEENTGLAEVVPIDLAREAIELSIENVGMEGFTWAENC